MYSTQSENVNWRPRNMGENQNMLPERNAVKKTIYITDVDHQVWNAAYVDHQRFQMILPLDLS